MRTPVRSRFPPPLIKLAERDDIPELVRVWLAAERTNLLMFYHFPTEESKSEYAKQVIKQFEDNFDKPHLLILKAVDPDTNQITALAVWQKRGYKLSAQTDKLFAAAGIMLNGALESSSDGVCSNTVIQSLERYIETQFEQFLASWSRSSKHLYLALLMTDPRFQRRGIGTAMLEWGHKQADQAGVPAFLIASPVGHPLYQHVGWKDVDTPLQIDLSRWAAGAQGGDMGWGVYKYYYMLRMPETAAS
jgi:GNAT superfamily N-acetyltransferase